MHFLTGQELQPKQVHAGQSSAKVPSEAGIWQKSEPLRGAFTRSSAAPDVSSQSHGFDSGLFFPEWDSVGGEAAEASGCQL